jgi:ribosome-associated toxin RatA of RatAB toxin-antitoxin module
MSTVNRSALVTYTPEQMYALVNDIEAYPQFLPWCRRARVLSRDEDEVRATIEFAKGHIHKSFTTRNRLQPNKMIEVRLITGPFRRLDGFWRFDRLGPGASRVCLDLEFEFANMVLSLAVGPVFNQIANTLVDAFVKRAPQVYGER